MTSILDVYKKIRIQEQKEIERLYLQPDIFTKEKILENTRFKIVRVRIRNGKIQRRHKVSNLAGYTFRGSSFVRISPRERLRRKIGARRAKYKRAAHRSQIRLRTKRALQRRKTLGV